MKSFISATSIKKDWQQAADDLLQQLGRIPAEANVAFIYATDSFATELSRLLDELKDKTTIENWGGRGGKGIGANKQEIDEQPAVTSCLLRESS